MSDQNALIARIIALRPRGRRTLVAVAGPPASGKSTLAEELVDNLGPIAALVPMDGFHLDNRVLDARGLRSRKGSPQSFDAAGFVQMIRRLAREDEVIVPVFDRARDIAIAGAQVIGPDVQIAIVEGNYLLLDREPWRDLQPLWDLSVFLDVGIDVLTQRLIQRWLDLDHPLEEARARAQGNDLPNAKRVLQESMAPDMVI